MMPKMLVRCVLRPAKENPLCEWRPRHEIRGWEAPLTEFTQTFCSFVSFF